MKRWPTGDDPEIVYTWLCKFTHGEYAQLVEGVLYQQDVYATAAYVAFSHVEAAAAVQSLSIS